MQSFNRRTIVGLQLSATKAIKLKAFHNFTAMCSTGFEKVSHKDASIRLWKSSPGSLIGTCHLTDCRAPHAHACANLVPIPRALKNYMEPP